MLHKITSYSQLDPRKLMDLYEEGNRENIPYVYPDSTNEEESLKKMEEGFLSFLEDEFFTQEKNICWVLEENGAYISSFRLSEVKERFFYLEALQTHPDFRRQGFASKLLNSVIAELQKEGSFTICDCVRKTNVASLQTHKKCGFQVVSEEGFDYLDNTSNPKNYSMMYRFD